MLHHLKLRILPGQLATRRRSRPHGTWLPGWWLLLLVGFSAHAARGDELHNELTVITHGLRTKPGLPPWVAPLRAELAKNRVDSFSLDWSAESNNAAPGWSEAAGNRIFAQSSGWISTHNRLPTGLVSVGAKPLRQPPAAPLLSAERLT